MGRGQVTYEFSGYDDWGMTNQLQSPMVFPATDGPWRRNQQGMAAIYEELQEDLAAAKAEIAEMEPANI